MIVNKKENKNYQNSYLKIIIIQILFQLYLKKQFF